MPSVEGVTDLSIAILCGGDSSRFGEDKTRELINGVPLYKLIWNNLAGESEDVFLQVAPGDEYDLPTEVDLIPEGGPLAGIYSALSHAENDWLFVSACDLPNLDPEIVEVLLDEVGSENYSEVVIPRWENGYYEPLAALYNRTLLPDLEKLIEEGTRKITEILRVADGVREVSVEKLLAEDKISSGCFFNLNTREDLEKLDLA